MKCSIDGCERSILARGWCGRHYQRWYSHGSPEITLVNQSDEGEAGAFLDGLIGTSRRKCIHWPFGKTGADVPAIQSGDRVVSAVRVLLIKTHGKPKPEQVAMKKCRGATCINPNHFCWATRSEVQQYRRHMGTSNRGRSIFRVPESAHLISQIEQMTASGITQTAISEALSLSRQRVRTIQQRSA